MNTQQINFNKLSFNVLIILLMTMWLASCDGKSNVGKQKKAAPIASVTVLAAVKSDGVFKVRAGSDILITGKDSDGIDAPILTFTFTIKGVTGDDLSIEQVDALLLEKTNNTKLFRTPKVTTETTIEFELTVTDSDNVSASDTLILSIIPIADADSFLMQKALSNSKHDQYELVAALALPSGEVSGADFEILIETIAEWDPREPLADCKFGVNENRCQAIIGTETLNGDWPIGFLAEDVNAIEPTIAAFNPHYIIDIPIVDIDKINQNFEQSNREKRIELAAASNVSLMQRFSFISAGNSSQLILLDPNNDNSDLLTLSNSDESMLLDVDLIRQNVASESKLSATAYYQLIDPRNEKTTLESWCTVNGFIDQLGDPVEGVHAVYTNNYDLGFGRDMYMRTDSCGNVFSFVENYPSLENAIQHRNKFATVAMEYSPLNTPTDGTCSIDKKIVKFYAFVPDEITGLNVRSTSMNFDGRGDKFLPGVCTSCHGGATDGLTAMLANISSSNNLALELEKLTEEKKQIAADLDSTFMPFDLDSFLYPETDPSLNQANISAAQHAQFARESQHDQFRSLNKAVLHTYLANPNVADRFEAPIALINSWYDTQIIEHEGLSSIDNQIFDGSNIVEAWQGESNLYFNVFARNCRACHFQLSTSGNNFDDPSEFISANDDAIRTRLIETVFQSGVMPLARLTYDRFWVDFNGQTPAAQILQEALGLDSGIIPGLPNAKFRAFLYDDTGNINELVKDESNNTFTVNEVDKTIRFDALQNTLAEDFNWSLNSENAGCNDNDLIGSNTARPSFVTTSSPCEYNITISTANNFGSAEVTQILLVDRIPEVLNFTAALNHEELPYILGSSEFTIDIDPQIMARGDNDQSKPLEIVNLQLLSGGNNEEEISIKDNAISVIFTPLGAVDINIGYQLSDINNSLSKDVGVLTVDIPQIRPSQPQLLNSTESSVTINWLAIDDDVLESYQLLNIQANSYKVFRKLQADADFTILNEISGDEATVTPNGNLQYLFTDLTIESGTIYDYNVVAVYGETSSVPSEIRTVTTKIGTPSSIDIVVLSSSSVTIEWTMTGNTDGLTYTIKRYRGNNTNSTPEATFANISELEFTDTGLDANQTYSYEVIVVSNAGESEPTATSATTLPIAPNVSVAAAPETTDSLIVSWTDGGNANTPQFRLLIGGNEISVAADNVESPVTQAGLPSNLPFSVTVQAIGIGGGIASSEIQVASTNISYANNILKGPIATQGCLNGGCHSDGLVGDGVPIKDVMKSYSCIVVATGYGSACNISNMAGLTFTEKHLNLIINWRSQGALD